MLAFAALGPEQTVTAFPSRLIVVAGAGDLGGRLAAARAALGDQVFALRRQRVDAGSGPRFLQADLATGAGLEQVPRRPDALVFCAAPDRRDEAAYRSLYLDGLRRLLDQLQCPRWLLVSSTAVYAEDAGEWVDEATPARPPQFNGRVLLAAERELAAHAGACTLRLSGLYGPGREALLRRARAGGPPRRRWSNRIHVEDAADALSHLLDLPAPADLYLGNDDLPAREDAVFAWLREREGLPPLPAPEGPECGRRVANARLRASGWRPRHPDFRSGYADLLAGGGV